ncbi:MAG TPA: decaprenyl-phosphate phosphoribosyltransferase [Streptosporangiaceae bacterium]|jgi:decaprenyl-phosphate phosphoribosyltransferase|nr:decaprenyl-phosphate phosphoribosyltransferase [Streptosporangiaceae bacterium]
MTFPSPAAKVTQPHSGATARLSPPLRWLVAVVQSTRPRQWPKNLLVFAAPLAGDTFGRKFGFWYALVALGAFIAASSAVYLINDVVDAERDRGHPYKRYRPMASRRLPAAHAVVLAAALVISAVCAGLIIGEPLLTAAVAAYLAISLLYSAGLKHVPVVELACVASGFVLRVVGGAAATHVPPSGYFLLVCSLGALMVAIAKRYTELVVLGADAVNHRPAMRGYSAPVLRLTQRAVSSIMIVSYVLWAWSEPHARTRSWQLVSSLALAGALVRFDQLTARATSKPVEDLIARDPVMVLCEAAWLILFAVGL